MVRDFLKNSGLTQEQIDRVSWLVEHHHTFQGIDGSDYQILIEADYIANASENGYPESSIRNFMEKWMKTESGKQMIKDIFCL
jgi:anaerobic ribonucleoside-triphosphate reductase